MFHIFKVSIILYSVDRFIFYFRLRCMMGHSKKTPSWEPTVGPTHQE